VKAACRLAVPCQSISILPLRRQSRTQTSYRRQRRLQRLPATKIQQGTHDGPRYRMRRLPRLLLRTNAPASRSKSRTLRPCLHLQCRRRIIPSSPRPSLTRTGILAPPHRSGLYRRPRILCPSTSASVSPTISTPVMQVSPRIHQKQHLSQASRCQQMFGRLLPIRRLSPVILAGKPLTMARQLSRPLNQSTSASPPLSHRLSLTPRSSLLSTRHHDEDLPLTNWLQISVTLPSLAPRPSHRH